MNVGSALTRLRELLPLAERRRRLPRAVATVHRAILVSFLSRGRPLSTEEVEALAPGGDAEAVLAQLSQEDLVVLGPEGRAIEGAYPFTTARTPHRLTVNGNHIQAMCALDALAVGPMSGAPVTIDSACHATGEPVRLLQRGREIVEAAPSDDVHVGIQWAATGGDAAHHL